MSSHCNRYPNCGCLPSVGTKCHLPEGDSKLLNKEIEPTEEEMNEFRKKLGLKHFGHGV